MKFNLINANIITLDNNNPNIKSLTIENGKIKSINKTKYCKNIKNFNEEIEFFFDESKQASEIYGNILL